MQIRGALGLVAFLVLVCWPLRPAAANVPCGCAAAAPGCATPAPALAYEEVEKTVLVPTLVTETRKVCTIECRAVPRQRTYTVARPVAETSMVAQTFTVLVPEMRTRTEKFMVCKPVMRQVTQEYTVPVPYTEQRQATRRVCNYLPVNETRTVMVPETRTKTCTLCGPNSPPVTENYTVCVPKEQTVVVNKPQWTDVPYTYEVTLCRPELRFRTVSVCDLVPEERTCEVACMVCVPRQQTCTVPVVTCRMVQEQRTENYVVQVPYTVEKEVQVQVCKMIPKTIKVKVPVCQPGCATAAPCCP